MLTICFRYMSSYRRKLIIISVILAVRYEMLFSCFAVSIYLWWLSIFWFWETFYMISKALLYISEKFNMIHFSIGIWWLHFLSWNLALFEHINFNCFSYTFITFLDYFFSKSYILAAAMMPTVIWISSLLPGSIILILISFHSANPVCSRGSCLAQ